MISILLSIADNKRRFIPTYGERTDLSKKVLDFLNCFNNYKMLKMLHISEFVIFVKHFLSLASVTNEIVADQSDVKVKKAYTQQLQKLAYLVAQEEA